MGLTVVILAAGEGKRMCSSLPKVLHPLAGKPLLAHVIATAKALDPEQIIVVYGHKGTQVKEAITDQAITWVVQDQQLGTGHAVQTALPKIKPGNQVLVLCGDVPLINVTTLRSLCSAATAKEVALMVVNLKKPEQYGRILRDKHDSVVGIVEAKDATPEQLLITEINTGIYLLPEAKLQKWLPALKANNAQTEYYLTDVVRLAVADGVKITTIEPATPIETLGVNTKAQLAELERAYQCLQAHSLMEKGVTLLDPQRFDLRGKVTVGEDVIIDVNVIFEGKVVIGDRCVIGANTILKNVVLGDDVEIKAFSYCEEAKIDNHCLIGPYARLRPGAELKAGVKVGNFVEIKKSVIDEGSKVNHLSYVGDAKVGKQVNIGAGTITCNYDGVHKFQTTIEDNVFVGSNVQLIAPVTLGRGATIGAGSTISKDAPADKLTVSRAKQVTIDAWKRPEKES